MSIRDLMGYFKLYHTIREENFNNDGNFEENIDLSEHISERLRKTYNNNEMVETSTDKLPQHSFDKQNMIKVPHRQVTYDEQL